MKHLLIYESFNHIHRLEMILTIFEDNGFIKDVKIKEFNEISFSIDFTMIFDNNNIKERTKRYNEINKEISYKLEKMGYDIESHTDHLSHINLFVRSTKDYFGQAKILIEGIDKMRNKMRVNKSILKDIMYISNGVREKNVLRFFQKRTIYDTALETALYNSTVFKFYLSYYHKNGGIPRNINIGISIKPDDECYEKIFEIIKMCNTDDTKVYQYYFLRILDIMVIFDYFPGKLSELERRYGNIFTEIEKIEIPTTRTELVKIINMVYGSQSITSHISHFMQNIPVVETMSKIIGRK